jgi:hypothetical protein
MSLAEVVIEGTLKADGTLELDEKPNLPAGRVTVVLRQEADLMLPKDDPFWQRMRAIWAIPMTGPGASDGGKRSLEEVQRVGEEWDEHQESLERSQRGARAAMPSPEEPKR